MLKSNSRYLKFGCFTLLQTNWEEPVTWTLEGLGSYDVKSPGIIRFHAPNPFAANGSVIDAGKTIIKCSRMVGDPGEEVEESETFTILYGTHLHVVADILKKEMSLDDDQIKLSWEGFKIPSDKKTRIVIESQTVKTLASNKSGDADNAVYSVNEIDSVRIEVYGINQSCRYMASMISIALESQYAEKQVSENSMKIISLPTNMNNVSAAEGSSGLKRFVGTFNVFYNLIKSKEEAYYDTFSDIQILERP